MTNLNQLIPTVSKIINNTSSNILFNTRVTFALKSYIEDDWNIYKLDPIENNYKKNVIYRDEKMSLELISWGSKSFTNIHDHAEYGCFMKVMDGRLRENIFSAQNNHFLRTKKLNTNTISYINNKIGHHNIFNENNNKNSYSIHLYFPGIYNTNTYNFSELVRPMKEQKYYIF